MSENLPSQSPGREPRCLSDTQGSTEHPQEQNEADQITRNNDDLRSEFGRPTTNTTSASNLLSTATPAERARQPRYRIVMRRDIYAESTETEHEEGEDGSAILRLLGRGLLDPNGITSAGPLSGPALNSLLAEGTNMARGLAPADRPTIEGSVGEVSKTRRVT
jgi:hypothetical protein